MREVTDATFEAEVLDAEGRRSSTSGRPWCKPCDAIAPVLEAIAADHGLGLVRLNIDEHIGVPSRYGVLSLPTVILFEDGEPRSTVVGARPARTTNVHGRPGSARPEVLVAGEVVRLAVVEQQDTLARLAAADHREAE